MLRHGWSALILALGIVAGTVLEPPGPDGIVDQSVFGLSAEALAQGHWWTLLSHAFLPVPVGGVVWLGAAFVILALTPMATANPGWLGGWRTPAIFIAAAGVGGAAHLLWRTSELHSGPWTAAAGLLLYYFFSGRSGLVFGRGTDATGVADDLAKREFDKAVLDWAEASVLLALAGILFQQWPLLPALGIVEAILLSLTFYVIGLVALHALGRLGGVVGRRIAGIMGRAAIVAALGAWLWQLGLWVIGNQAMLSGLPWASYLAGATVGLIAGLVERRTARAR